MNWIDYLLLALIVFSCIAGLMRGLLREVIALVTWIVAVWVAWTCAGLVEPHLGGALVARPPCTTDSTTDRSLLPPDPQPQFGARGPLNVFGPYSEVYGNYDHAKMDRRWSRAMGPRARSSGWSTRTPSASRR